MPYEINYKEIRPVGSRRRNDKKGFSKSLEEERQDIDDISSGEDNGDGPTVSPSSKVPPHLQSKESQTLNALISSYENYNPDFDPDAHFYDTIDDALRELTLKETNTGHGNQLDDKFIAYQTALRNSITSVMDIRLVHHAHESSFVYDLDPEASRKDAIERAINAANVSSNVTMDPKTGKKRYVQPRRTPKLVSSLFGNHRLASATYTPGFERPPPSTSRGVHIGGDLIHTVEEEAATRQAVEESERKKIAYSRIVQPRRRERHIPELPRAWREAKWLLSLARRSGDGNRKESKTAERKRLVLHSDQRRKHAKLGLKYTDPHATLETANTKERLQWALTTSEFRSKFLPKELLELQNQLASMVDESSDDQSSSSDEDDFRGGARAQQTMQVASTDDRPAKTQVDPVAKLRAELNSLDAALLNDTLAAAQRLQRKNTTLGNRRRSILLNGRRPTTSDSTLSMGTNASTASINSESHSSVGEFQRDNRKESLPVLVGANGQSLVIYNNEMKHLRDRRTAFEIAIKKTGAISPPTTPDHGSMRKNNSAQLSTNSLNSSITPTTPSANMRPSRPPSAFSPSPSPRKQSVVLSSRPPSRTPTAPRPPTSPSPSTPQSDLRQRRRLVTPSQSVVTSHRTLTSSTIEDTIKSEEAAEEWSDDGSGEEDFSADDYSSLLVGLTATALETESKLLVMPPNDITPLLMPPSGDDSIINDAIPSTIIDLEKQEQKRQKLKFINSVLDQILTKRDQRLLEKYSSKSPDPVKPLNRSNGGSQKTTIYLVSTLPQAVASLSGTLPKPTEDGAGTQYIVPALPYRSGERSANLLSQSRHRTPRAVTERIVQQYKKLNEGKQLWEEINVRPQKNAQLQLACSIRRAVGADINALRSLSESVNSKLAASIARLCKRCRIIASEKVMIQSSAVQKLHDIEFQHPDIDCVRRKEFTTRELKHLEFLDRVAQPGTTLYSERKEVAAELERTDLAPENECSDDDEEGDDYFEGDAPRKSRGDISRRVGTDIYSGDNRSKNPPDISHFFLTELREKANIKTADTVPSIQEESAEERRNRLHRILASDASLRNIYERKLTQLLRRNHFLATQQRLRRISQKRWFVLILQRMQRLYKKQLAKLASRPSSVTQNKSASQEESAAHVILPETIYILVSALRQLVCLDVVLTKEDIWHLIDKTIPVDQHRSNLVYSLLRHIYEAFDISAIEIYEHLKPKVETGELASQLMLDVKKLRAAAALREQSLREAQQLATGNTVFMTQAIDEVANLISFEGKEKLDAEWEDSDSEDLDDAVNSISETTFDELQDIENILEVSP